jgi:hypothetical protein
MNLLGVFVLAFMLALAPPGRRRHNTGAVIV